MPDALTPDALETVIAFTAAWGAHDLDATLALMTDDCRFESTGPSPDGGVHIGHEAVRAAWQSIFDDPDSNFVQEELMAAGDDAVVFRWTYHWADGHIRGIDLLRVREGKVAEKLSYVKG
jgi:ketosteroid isomerase-like protein